MHHPGFFERTAPIALQELAGMVGATLERAPERDALIRDVKPLQDAGPGDLSFFDCAGIRLMIDKVEGGGKVKPQGCIYFRCADIVLS